MTEPENRCRAEFEKWFFPMRESFKNNGILLDTNDANSMWIGWEAAWKKAANFAQTLKKCQEQFEIISDALEGVTTENDAAIAYAFAEAGQEICYEAIQAAQK